MGVPLIKEGVCIGGMSYSRPELEPYSPREIALAQTFADQAVIAIENARLFREQQEAVEQLTASADVLKIVSSFSASLDGVLNAVVQQALLV